MTTEIREFVKMAFKEVGIEVSFHGEGVDEVGVIVSCSDDKYQLPEGKEVVVIDPRYFRPTEVELLMGDPSKSKSKLGWEPKYDLAALVKDMMTADVALFEKDKYLQEGGHSVFQYYE